MLGIIADGQMPSVLREAFQESLVPFFCCKDTQFPSNRQGFAGKNNVLRVGSKAAFKALRASKALKRG